VRIAVIGGTRFIGAALVEELAAHEHDVMVMHRGGTEAEELPPVTHAHGDRRDPAALAAALGSHMPEVVVDTCAYTRAEAEVAVEALPQGTRCVVLSSQDVYRAFATLREGAAATDGLPLDEQSPVRGQDQRFLFRGLPAPVGGSASPDDYENLDVEEVYLARSAAVLRLPMVFGERDHQRREEFILRRVRAGRSRIPFGGGAFLWSRCWVRDVASAIRLAVETGAADGMAINVAERRTWSLAQWAHQILAAAGSDAALVRVADEALPEDLELTGTVHQHLLVSATAARRLLGWHDSDPVEAVRRSVAWHLDHPPAADDRDFSADEAALSQA